jgi:hypothetical protein
MNPRFHLLLFFFLFCILQEAFLQNVTEGTSSNYSFSITREVKPPILNIVDGSVRFIDPGGNNIIDAGETCKLAFSVENSGLGDGLGLTLKVTASGSTQGISFSPSRSLEILKVGKKTDVEIPVTANLNTVDGTITFTFKVDESNGFGTDEKAIEVKTLKFVSPLVEVVDYTVTGGRGGNLVKKVPFDLQILVQNTQYGKAEEVSVVISVPPNVVLLSGNDRVSMAILTPGEKQSIVYGLIVNDLFTGTSIPVNIKVAEKHGKYAKDRTLSLTLNQAVAFNKIVVEGNQPQVEVPEIVIGSLSAPVDKNIPETGQHRPERFALIIGNEDYSSRQPGLSKEVNVDFAENDARIFKEYTVKTLGVPDDQVKLLINATAAEIRRELTWICNLSRIKGGSAELIFYYSGHGLPDEVTREPYLIPVDVSGTTLREGIKVGEVYKRLTEHPCQRVTVFLDACFSGGARNQGLLARKTVKIKPNEEAITGNMVVFSSSSGVESSGVDREKQHGYFTWFLLQKLQQTKGDITYKAMGDYLVQNVSFETAKKSEPQTPQVLPSTEVQGKWESWKMN